MKQSKKICCTLVGLGWVPRRIFLGSGRVETINFKLMKFIGPVTLDQQIQSMRYMGNTVQQQTKALAEKVECVNSMVSVSKLAGELVCELASDLLSQLARWLLKKVG